MVKLKVSSGKSDISYQYIFTSLKRPVAKDVQMNCNSEGKRLVLSANQSLYCRVTILKIMPSNTINFRVLKSSL
jgi:hypothetical protein